MTESRRPNLGQIETRVTGIEQRLAALERDRADTGAALKRIEESQGRAEESAGKTQDSQSRIETAMQRMETLMANEKEQLEAIGVKLDAVTNGYAAALDAAVARIVQEISKQGTISPEAQMALDHVSSIADGLFAVNATSLDRIMSAGMPVPIQPAPEPIPEPVPVPEPEPAPEPGGGEVPPAFGGRR